MLQRRLSGNSYIKLLDQHYYYPIQYFLSNCDASDIVLGVRDPAVTEVRSLLSWGTRNYIEVPMSISTLSIHNSVKDMHKVNGRRHGQGLQGEKDALWEEVME